MQRQRGELVPVAEVIADLDGPVKAIREATPQAVHHFTRFDQVNQLVSASEADPDLGFMARTMALCSLPRTNPGNRTQYKHVNGPFTLIMVAGGGNKLPYGNLPRLLLAWAFARAASRISLMRSRSASGISHRSSICSPSETSATRATGGKFSTMTRDAARTAGTLPSSSSVFAVSMNRRRICTSPS